MIKNKNKYNSKDINSVKSRLVELSGINMNYVEFLDIYVNETETVHITIIDDFTVEDKLDVVFIHGLTGTSLYYYKCFVQLSKYMRIIALDLPGMGLSNRAFINYKKYNFEEAETFFVSRVDLALSKIGVDKFHFISHSFGGYISCLYYIHHPEKVLSMILLSPVGITSCYVEWISTPLEDLYQRVMYMFKKPPTEGYKIVPFADKILDKMLAHKLKYIKCDEEKEVFKDIVNFICKSTTTSEYLIYHFFNGTIQSYKPIIYYYEFFEKVKIDFIYGDRDWNPVDHAEEVIDYNINILFIKLAKKGFTFR